MADSVQIPADLLGVQVIINQGALRQTLISLLTRVATLEAQVAALKSAKP